MIRSPPAGRHCQPQRHNEEDYKNGNCEGYTESTEIATSSGCLLFNNPSDNIPLYPPLLIRFPMPGGRGVHEIPVRTRSRTDLIDITSEVQRAVAEAKEPAAICTVFVPHTTAGITINENADPSVRRDILAELNKVIPFDDHYAHSEGNSAAHIKAGLVGSSVNVPVEDGRLQLGTWQGIYFCEFDGPRTRRVWIQLR